MVWHFAEMPHANWRQWVNFNLYKKNYDIYYNAERRNAGEKRDAQEEQWKPDNRKSR